MESAQKRHTLGFRLKIIMLGVLATAVTFTNCHLDDNISLADVVVATLPETDPLPPPTPPQTRWQVMVGDTNLRVDSHTDLFQLEDGSFTCGIGQEDVRFHVISPTGVRRAEHITSTTVRGGNGFSSLQAPILIDDEFVFGTTALRQRVNPLTGEIRWSDTESGRFTPAIPAGMLVQSSYEGPSSLFTVDNETGNKELVQFFDKEVAAQVYYHFSKVIESTTGEKLIVLGQQLVDSLLPSGADYQLQVRDFQTFELRWSYDAVSSQSWYDATLAVVGDLLVLPINNTMHGFDIASGDVVWEWTWDAESYTSAYGANTKLSWFNFRFLDYDPSQDLIVAGGYEQVFAIKASTGQILWQRDMDDRGGVSILNDDYGLYTTGSGYHVLIDLNHGYELGRITPLNTKNPNVESRGFVTDDGKGVVLFDGISIYAVDFETFELEE